MLDFQKTTQREADLDVLIPQRSTVSDYTVIQETLLADLIDKVKLYVEAGWVPSGGVAQTAARATGAGSYIQALVKY